MTPDAPPSRHLALAGCFNVRDTGGYPTRDGGVVRWRTLLRADALHRLDDSGRCALSEIGVRTVIDLRDDSERTIAPSALDGVALRVLHRPIYDRSHERAAGLVADLDRLYQDMVDLHGPALAVAIAELCEPGALPAVVHSSAGKDRTGVVIALVLEIAGVSDRHIAEDYALTAAYLGDEFVHAVRQSKASTGVSDAAISAVLRCPPELVLGVLRRIRQQHGSITGFLVHHGLSAAQLDGLRTALVETQRASFASSS
ncbi:MAG: tyrosine-protein phosphatase [Haloechinothrix sp.]